MDPGEDYTASGSHRSGVGYLYLKDHTDKQHSEQAYNSCSSILSLALKAGNDRLASACRRADSYCIYNYPIIAEILAKKLDSWQEGPEPSAQEEVPEHINIRGNDYYQ